MRASSRRWRNRRRRPPSGAAQRAHPLPVVLLLLVHSLRLGQVSSSFASIPPPRFDSFADIIVGKWEYGTSGESQEVEEVMRSCGGAVQGVREVPLLVAAAAGGEEVDLADHRGPYHNRADDGFVYFDCGSYSAGPVRIECGGGAAEAATAMMGSLTLPSVPKRRVLISASITSDDSNGGIAILAGGASLAALSRASFRSSPAADAATDGVDQDCKSIDPPAVLSCLDGPPVPVRWVIESACRMSSPAQPWMLQRAKWEGFGVRPGADNVGDGAATSSLSDGGRKPGREDLVGWTAISAAGGKSNKLWGDAGLDFMASDEEDGSVVVQMGALCRMTGRVRAVLRSYDGSGNLRGVALQEGTAES